MEDFWLLMLTLDSKLLLNLGCPLGSLGVAAVEQRNVGAGFGETSHHRQTDSGASAGDNSRLPLQREQREQAPLHLLRRGGIVDDEVALIQRRSSHD